VYHTGLGVKKSGPKGPSKVKGEALEIMLGEFNKDPSAPSHVIAERVLKKTGVWIAPRTVRDARNTRGKTRLLRQTRREASARMNHHTSS